MIRGTSVLPARREAFLGSVRGARGGGLRGGVLPRSRARDRRLARANPAVLIALAAAAVCVVGDFGHTFDDPYILMRYARNLAGGDGWTLVPGEVTTNIATSTGYVVVLAALARVGLSVPLAATAVFAASLVGTAWFVHAARPGPGGAVGAALVVLSPQLISMRGMETWLLLALVSAATWAIDDGRDETAAWLTVGAFLVRPDGILVAVALAGWHRAVRGHWPRRYLVVAVLGTAVAGVLILATVGLPASLEAKRLQANAPWWSPFGHDIAQLVIQAPVWWGLALAGVAMNRQSLAHPVTWCAATYMVAYTVLGVASYPWYYAVPLLGLAVAAGSGLGRVSPRAALVLALAGTIAVPRTLPPQRLEMAEAGRWLRDVAPGGATLGASEIGIIGWHSDLSMRSYLGLLHAERGRALGTDRMTAWIEADRPDYLLVTYWAPDQATARVAEDDYEPAWVGQHVQVWQRNAAQGANLDGRLVKGAHALRAGIAP